MVKSSYNLFFVTYQPCKKMQLCVLALYLCILLLLPSLSDGVGFLSGPLLSAAVGARSQSARRFRAEGGGSIAYDEFGRIPELEEAQNALDSARSIAVIRLQNQTTVGMVDDAPSNNTLSVPIGVNTINVIVPGVHLVITGLSADARYLIRAAKKKAVEYAHLFDKPISPRYLSSYLGKLIRDNYMNNRRPIVNHMFVVGSRTVWEVNCLGIVQEIVAGAAGVDRQRAIDAIESKFNATLSRDDCHSLLCFIYREQVAEASGSHSPQVIRVVDIPDTL